MLWQWSPGVIAELIASAILLVLAIYFPWRDLNRQVRLTGATLIFVCALWMLSNGIEIGFPVASYKEFMVGAQLVLGTIALTLWLFYILHYLGPRKLLNRRIYILSCIMPLIAILALSTNSVTGLMWTEIGLDSQNPYLPLQPAYGIVYWAFMVYLSVLTLAGSFIIIWSIFRRHYTYSRESIYLLAAAVITLTTAFIEVTGLTAFSKLPVGLTPWAACIGAVIVILNLPRLHTEQVIPVARDIIFERIGDCILVLDMQNRVLDLNPAAEQLTGYKISDAFGLAIERIWPYGPTPMTPFNKMVETGDKLILERNGKKRAYDLRISTTTDPGGRQIGQVVLLTDITEREKAEEDLRESEDKYRVLVESAGEGICVLQDGVLKFVNSTLAATAGLSIDEMTNKSFLDYVHPEDSEMIIERESRRLRGEEFETSYTFRALNKAGHTKWVNLNAVMITWEGKPATLNFLMDITERKHSEEKLLRSYESLQKTLNDALNTMVMMLEMRDPYTAGHQQRVAELATAIAREMKFEDSRIDQLRMAAIIHDIGKMYVPSDILSKPGRLSEIEFNLIKTHSQCGYDIVKGMDFPCSVAKVVLQHHERLDGSGYPNQLKSEDLLIEAKILAVADVIEAMASHRPYRPALGIARALEEISSNKGKLYDAEVVDVCIELFNSGKFEFKPV